MHNSSRNRRAALATSEVFLYEQLKGIHAPIVRIKYGRSRFFGEFLFL